MYFFKISRIVGFGSVLSFLKLLTMFGMRLPIIYKNMACFNELSCFDFRY